MEEFLRVFTSMYKASAMSEAIMSNVFEQLVQYQKTETVHATMASSAGGSCRVNSWRSWSCSICCSKFQKPSRKDANPYT